MPLFEYFRFSLNLLMRGKDFNRIILIEEREVAVNLVPEHGLSEQVWRTFVFEYGQVVVRSRCQDYHLRKRYCTLPPLSYHVQFHAIVVHVLGFPLQVTIGMESTMETRESQSSGLNDCIMVSANTLKASESMFKRALNVW